MSDTILTAEERAAVYFVCLEDLEKHQVAHAKRLDEAFDHIDRRLGELGERVAKNEGRFGR